MEVAPDFDGFFASLTARGVELNLQPPLYSSFSASRRNSSRRCLIATDARGAAGRPRELRRRVA